MLTQATRVIHTITRMNLNTQTQWMKPQKATPWMMTFIWNAYNRQIWRRESQLAAARDSGDGGRSDRVFFRGDENILALGHGEGYVTLGTHSTELCLHNGNS